MHQMYILIPQKGVGHPKLEQCKDNSLKTKKKKTNVKSDQCDSLQKTTLLKEPLLKFSYFVSNQ